MEYHIVYAKFDGCKSFKAFDVNEGRQVGNLIYASLVENTEDTRSKLQKMDARASRLLMSTRADKWAISFMPHWLRTQKIPGLNFRNSQT